jgi:quinol monooxygenase YgiN
LVGKSPTPCIVVVTLTPHPEDYATVRNLVLEVIPAIHDDPGCLLYALHDTTTGQLVLIEAWADRAAWLAHFELPGIKRLKKELPPWLAAPASRVEMYGVGVGHPTLGGLITPHSG